MSSSFLESAFEAIPVITLILIFIAGIIKFKKR